MPAVHRGGCRVALAHVRAWEPSAVRLPAATWHLRAGPLSIAVRGCSLYRRSGTLVGFWFYADEAPLASLSRFQVGATWPVT
eukprot:320888-Prymnesium_polylepis.1